MKLYIHSKLVSLKHMPFFTFFGLCVLARLANFRAYVFTCFACLTCSCAYVLTCLACLRALVYSVLTFSRDWCAYVLASSAYLRAHMSCMLVVFKYFSFLCACVLGILVCLICFTFQKLNSKKFSYKIICLCCSIDHIFYLFPFLFY